MDKLKYFEDKDPWMLAEDIPECFFFFAQVWLSSFANDLEKSCGRNYKKVLSVFHGSNMKFYYGENDSREFEEKLVQKIIDQPQFGEDINKYIYLYSDKLREFTNKLAYANLPKISSKEICDWIEEHDKIHTQLYEWGWLSNATDMFHNTFTNRLINYLFALTKNRLKANQYLSILSSPQTISVLNDQQIELLEIIDQIQQNNPAIHKISRENLTPCQTQLIKEYWQKYHHIKFLWIGSSGAYKLEDYFSQINEFLKTGLQARNEISRINKEVKENIARKKDLIKKISLNKKWIRIFDIYAEFMLTKAYRREAQIYWSFHMNKLLQEVANRLKLKVGQVYFMLPQEFEMALLRKRFDPRQLYAREKFCIYYVEKGREAFMMGKKAKEIEKSLEKKYGSVAEFQGSTGCLGKASGLVRIINTPKDMVKMKNGDILVAIATNPDIVPAMKKAAAIVTEQGGITSHAAIVSRELKIPCVIATKIATKVLHDGDLVEVDANEGMVRILKRTK